MILETPAETTVVCLSVVWIVVVQVFQCNSSKVLYGVIKYSTVTYWNSTVLYSNIIKYQSCQRYFNNGIFLLVPVYVKPSLCCNHPTVKFHVLVHLVQYNTVGINTVQYSYIVIVHFLIPHAFWLS